MKTIEEHIKEISLTIWVNIPQVISVFESHLTELDSDYKARITELEKEVKIRDRALEKALNQIMCKNCNYSKDCHYTHEVESCSHLWIAKARAEIEKE